MTTNTTTKPALAVVWPASTFWPPNTDATVRAITAHDISLSPLFADHPASQRDAANIVTRFLILTLLADREPRRYDHHNDN